MARAVVPAEFQVVIRVPEGLPARAAAVLRRRAGSGAFRRAVARAVFAALGSRVPAGTAVVVSR